MANFIGISRSNYFKVKDEHRFETLMDLLDLTVRKQSRQVVAEGEPDPDTYFMVFPEEGDWPSFDDEDKEIDVVKQIMPHLADGEVCILHTIGYEKLRYLNHAMVAFNSAGVIAHQSQESFYDELNRLGHLFTRAET